MMVGWGAAALQLFSDRSLAGLTGDRPQDLMVKAKSLLGWQPPKPPDVEDGCVPHTPSRRVER
jgi:hypothetical protein